MTRRRLTSKQREAGPIKIDVGVPFPSKGSGRPGKYPWAKMNIGDSILFKSLPASSVTPQASKAGRALGFKFATRLTPEGVRVWRTG